MEDKLKEILRHLKVLLVMSKNSFMVTLMNKTLFLLFLSGKVIRFSFFFVFLYFLVRDTGNLLGFSANQVIFFFLTFNFIDIVGQFLFREVYRFRPKIVRGEFDLILSKPIKPIIRVLFGGLDVIDLFTIPPLIAALIWSASTLDPTFSQVVLYIFLIANGLLLATAFHIAVISLGIITLEVDNVINIYRDAMNLGRLPIDIYKEPLRSVITYLIPVGIMITIPAKALMGIVSLPGVLVSFSVGTLAIVISVKFWNYALKFYTSASS